MEIETDILVIGASASGSCAAIQAGRMGRKVVLCEPTPWVGGMLTAAGVSAIDGNHRLPSGLWGEFQRALRDHYGGPEAVETGWVSNTLFDPRVGQDILRKWIDSLDTVDLCLGYRCADILKDGNRVAGAAFQRVRSDAPADRLVVHSRITILADEYGDAVEDAGIPWRTGLDSRELTNEPEAPALPLAHPQDFTWAATVSAPPSGFAARKPGPEFPEGSEFHGFRLSPPLGWDRVLDYGRLPGNLVMLNWPRQDCYGDYLDRTRRAQVLGAGRAKTQRLVQALQEHFGTDQIGTPRIYPTGHLALMPYIREARRIIALETLASPDLTDPAGSASTETAIAVGDYPMDHHRSFDPDAPEIQFPRVNAFTVPYGVMVPESFDGVLVAEKSIGVTGLVNGCTRLQPVVMQIGQAAGAAAALCVAAGLEPRELGVWSLQETLQDAGVFLAPGCDLPPDSPEFRPFHWAASRGLLALRYEPQGWANRAYFDPHLPVSPQDLHRAGATLDRLTSRPQGLTNRRLRAADRSVIERFVRSASQVIRHQAVKISGGERITRGEFARLLHETTGGSSTR